MNLLPHIAFLAAGFILLMKGADYFVEGASMIAAKFGIPQIVIGLRSSPAGPALLRRQ